MLIAGWAHSGPSMLAAFLASLVEAVEALTVILAVGSVRGWRGTLLGTASALAALLLLVAGLGPTLADLPLRAIRGLIGVLLLLFGLRWLRKAVLRAAGAVAMRDENAAFARQLAAMRERPDAPPGLDRIGFAAAFQITLVEGIEVVFIVIAIGAGGPGLLLPACAGAGGAVALVAVLGLALHRPLVRVPENTLKFAVGVLTSAFGTFWAGEGAGLPWPGGELAAAALVLGYGAVALLAVAVCRKRRRAATA